MVLIILLPALLLYVYLTINNIINNQKIKKTHIYYYKILSVKIMETMKGEKHHSFSITTEDIK